MQKKHKIVLLGSPNVGKSAIFNYLTGTYVTVSNYPGTTVDVARGISKVDKNFEIIDTPGLYSLIPFTEEEQVAKDVLFKEKPDTIIHVIDAKNIRRTLAMTLDLIDAQAPIILNLNMMDEANLFGCNIRYDILAKRLGIPVVATSATQKIGLKELQRELLFYKSQHAPIIKFNDNIEQAIQSITAKLQGEYGMSLRMVAILLMRNDTTLLELIKKEAEYDAILQTLKQLTAQYNSDLNYVLTLERQEQVNKLLKDVIIQVKGPKKTWTNTLDKWTRETYTGYFILGLVLYFGVYQFVGRFSAGFLVDYLDTRLFDNYLNPLVESIVNTYIPSTLVQSLIIGEYGIFSLGFRYAVVIILPIVGCFFLFFALLEDSGYLPRLAMLMDNVFKCLGLNGRAVIPITLGLGCGSMAVIVTRTLESKRERIIGTFLLALSIPCSAQLGVVLALLSHNWLSILIWTCYIVGMFFLAGLLSSFILPGKRSSFYMELPPLRLPLLSNVIVKAYTRMVWYFLEILPIFIITSIVLWICDSMQLLGKINKLLEPVMNLLGLPPELAQIFLLGFFRRDYGAAGLYDLSYLGMLTEQQLVVAAITMTLFVPCVAQFAIILKERGVVFSLILIIIIAVIAMSSGMFINQLLNIFNIY